MGPQNGILGDDNFGIELPQTEVQTDQLDEVRKMAKYSKSTEFKKLEEHIKTRIDFYQKYLPDGTPIATADHAKRADNWAVANVVIEEFNGILNAYALAAQEVKDADA